jgi:tetratricopeptide (TPR) repeat protein
VIHSKLNKRAVAGLVAGCLAVVLAGTLVSSCGTTRSTSKKKTYPVAGVVIEAPGHFDNWPDGFDCWIPGAPGSVALYGDSVRNGTGGGLIMVLSSGGTVRAGDNTEYEVGSTSPGAPVVDVQRGDVWLAGSSKGSLKTSSVTVKPAGTGGKGADRVVGVKAVPAGSTTVTVYDGSVTLEAAGSDVELNAGYSSTCEAGKPPSKPVKTADKPPGGGLAYLVNTMRTPFFRNEATRAKTEDDAKAKLQSNPEDAWSNVNLGRALLDAGKTAEAKECFSKALEVNKGFAQAFAGLGRAALDEGKWDEAGRLYELARLADQNSIEALLGEAAAALGSGNLDDAEKWYKGALDLDAESQAALAGLGAVYLMSGRVDDARDNLAKAIAIDPANVAGLRLLAVTSSLKGDLDASISYLKRAADARPGDAHIRASLADVYFRTGQKELASSSYKRLTETDDPPVMSAGFEGMGAVAQRSADLKSAVMDWSKAQDLVPDRPAVLEDLGQAQLMVGEIEAAIAALSRATEVDITDWRAHTMLGRAYFAAGSWQAAVTEGQAAVKLAPEEWSAHMVLGLALEATGAKAEGAVEIDRGLDLKPDKVTAAADHALLAEGLRLKGRVSDALAEYRAAEAASPSQSTYYRLAGDMLLQLGRKSEALAQYRKAAQVDPRDSLAQVKVAQALHESGKKNDAIDTLQKAIAKDPNNPAPRVLLGEYLLADGDAEGAIFQLDEAISRTGTAPKELVAALVVRGNAFDHDQNFAKAIEDYSRAVSTDPSRGDAWFYLAGDLERTGRVPDARNAYASAVTLCKDKAEWKKFYDEAAAKLNQLK